jgi:phosphoribosyl-AMP cyclohydrolase
MNAGTLSAALAAAVKWDERGLVAAIAQDADSREVLMMAWMNAEALALTLETGRAHYWSRSRGRLWEKGATSGHRQAVRAIALDCDGDTLLLAVEQTGAACHTGRRNCFFRSAANGSWVIDEALSPVLTSPGRFPE